MTPTPDIYSPLHAVKEAEGIEFAMVLISVSIVVLVFWGAIYFLWWGLRPHVQYLQQHHDDLAKEAMRGSDNDASGHGRDQAGHK